ncbi:MAG: hypothetical protein PHV42_04555 [Candidatus Pacebacteria bacterium]|nr:hypothetical protein [Candidatus Paceibacterota bacterium]
MNDLEIEVAAIHGGKTAAKIVKLRQIKEGSRLPGLFDPLSEDIKLEGFEKIIFEMRNK